jgi:hypothetical protein
MYGSQEGDEFVYYNEELEKNCDAVKWEEETSYCIYDYCFEEEDCTDMKDWENSEAKRKYDKQVDIDSESDNDEDSESDDE